LILFCYKNNVIGGARDRPRPIWHAWWVLLNVTGILRIAEVPVIARLARSVGASALACLAGTAVVLVAIQALTGRWSLHATLDLGGTLVALATAVTAATCLPIFALLRGPAVFSTPGREALIGAASASLTGVIAVSWFFADGIYPQDFGDWLRVLTSVFFVPFPIGGAAFGYAWSRGLYFKVARLGTH
jgi:hypothetical protein